MAIGELQLLFTEHNQADFIELTQRAEKALGDLGDTGEPDNPSELALALDYMLSHLLMDEFQDTSITHFKLIEKLTAGWQRDDGRTVFLVGDPMQSNYRFRESRSPQLSEGAKIRAGCSAARSHHPQNQLPLVARTGGVV